MTLPRASFRQQPLEALLPRSVKQTLVVVMALLILFLLASLETGNSTPFLYIGF